MHRSPIWRWTSVLLVAIVAVACSSTQGATRAGSTTTRAPAATIGPVPAPQSGYTPFFLKNGFVSPGHRRPVDPKDPIGTALTALIDGPDAVDQAAGLSNAVAPDVVIDSLSLKNGVVLVDLSRRFESANTRPQVGQVVYTLTQFQGVNAVQFLVDGTPNGAAGVDPQSRADLEDMTPPVLPLTPAPADRLSRTFRCQGLTQLAGPIVCTVHLANGRVAAATVVPDSTTTSTTTTLAGLAPGTTPPGSVEFNVVVTLAAPVHGPATIVVGPPRAEFGVPLASVAVTFT